MAQKHKKGLGNTCSKPPKARKWCITLNNYTQIEEDAYLNYFRTHQDCKWVIGHEVGENGTPHLQIWFRMKNAVSFNTVKRLCDRAHIEKANGTMAQNFRYCSKEGNFNSNISEFGLLSANERRAYILSLSLEELVALTGPLWK